MVTLSQLSKHISQHGSPYTRDVIVGVITSAVDCLRELLLEGHKVQLGDLGSFYVTLSSEGVEDAAKFNPQQHITKVNVRWDSSEYFDNLRPEAQFQMVLTRKEQQAAKKQFQEELNKQITSSESDNQGGSGQGDPGDVTP